MTIEELAAYAQRRAAIVHEIVEEEREKGHYGLVKSYYLDIRAEWSLRARWVLWGALGADPDEVLL